MTRFDALPSMSLTSGNALNFEVIVGSSSAPHGVWFQQLTRKVTRLPAFADAFAVLAAFAFFLPDEIFSRVAETERVGSPSVNSDMAP